MIFQNKKNIVKNFGQNLSHFNELKSQLGKLERLNASFKMILTTIVFV